MLVSTIRSVSLGLLPSRRPPADDGIADAGRADVGTHVVHPDDIDSGSDPEGGRRDRRLQPFVRRQIQDLPEGRLPGRPEQDGPTEVAQAGELAQHLDVLRRGLPEADAGVDDETGRWHPETLRP